MHSKHELPPMPVIVGAPRSGTTMLRLMLDAHPDLAIPPETGFLSELASLDGEGDALRASTLQLITSYPPDAPAWADFGLSADDLKNSLDSINPLTATDVARAFYRQYAARFGKKRLGDKTPSYAFHIAAISRLLPEARFIHLVRDGRDVALSLRDVWFGPGNAPDELAAAWVAHVEAAEDDYGGCIALARALRGTRRESGIGPAQYLRIHRTAVPRKHAASRAGGDGRPEPRWRGR